LNNISLSTAPPATQQPGTTVGTSLGSLSAAVVAKTLTDVTSWGQSLAQAPVFNNVDLSSGVSSGNGVTFSATLNILNGAKSQRIAEYSVPSK
jgi:hypothetical protein